MRLKAALVAGCCVLAILPGARAAAATRTVSVTSNVFTPSTLEAVAGDEVVWTFDGGTHNVTAYEGASFESPNQSSGTFSATFQGSTVRYRCTLHSSLSGGSCARMCGVIRQTDTTPPPPPTITEPVGGSRFSSKLVAFSGGASGDAASVRIESGGRILGETTVSGGAWAVPIGFDNGSHTARAVALDAAGNASAGTSVTFTVDGPPGPPPPVILEPAGNAIVNDTMVFVDARGWDGTEHVLLKEAGSVLATLDANADGTFSQEVGFGNGDHTITATGVDAAGLEGETSAPVSFAVDSQRPAVSVAQPGSTTVVVRPFTVAGTATDNRAISTIELRWGAFGEAPNRTADLICTGCGTTAAQWSAIVNPEMPGVYDLRVTVVDQAGNFASASRTVLAL